MAMAEAVLGLGANLGSRRALMCAAAALLDALPGCAVLARSALYESAPLGPPQPHYLNAALRVRCEGDAASLFTATQRVETLLGRERRVRWGARTLDIDLLHWSEGPVRTDELEVPHRELAARAFALAPLLDVAPELAPHWAPVLASLAGAPPRAEPGWPTPQYEDGCLCSEWQDDVDELIASACTLLARCSGLSARPHSARPFSVPLPLQAGLAWVTRAIGEAVQSGFAVHSGVVFAHDGSYARGVLLGEARAEQLVVSLPEVRAEQRERAEQRVKIRCDEPDRRLVSGGSGTM